MEQVQLQSISNLSLKASAKAKFHHRHTHHKANLHRDKRAKQ